MQKKQASAFKPVAFTSSLGSQLNEDIVKGSICKVREEFVPFVSEGFISLDDGEGSPQYPIVILRDTGASQSLILKDAVPLNEKSSLGAGLLITGVGNDSFHVPLHQVILKSELISGPMTVGVTPTLPQGLEGITLLLGNDVAGKRVVAEPYMTQKPSSINHTIELEEEFPDKPPILLRMDWLDSQSHTAEGK